MIRLYSTLCCIATLWITCSCGDSEVSRSLNDIESYILERPNSALVALRAIDKEQIGASKDKAKYSLLYAMALDKNYIDTTDVSVIQPAIDYYERTDDVESRMKAYYYLGRIQQNGKKSQDALLSFFQAYELRDKSIDNRYKMMITAILYQLYSNRYMSDIAKKYAEEAMEYAELLGDRKAIWIMKGQLARAYANNREKTKADSLYRVYMTEPVLDTTIFAKNILFYSRILVSRKPSNPQRSIEVFREATKIYHAKPNVEDYYVHAYALDLSGERKTADKILKEVESRRIGEVERAYWKYRIYKNRGMLAEALPCFERCISKQDSLIISNLHQTLESTQKEYLYEKAKKEEEQRKADRSFFIIIGLSLIVIIVLIMFIGFVKHHRMQEKLTQISWLKKETEKQLCFTSEKLQEKEEYMERLRQKYMSTYREQYQILNELCSSYLAPSFSGPRERIYNNVKKILAVFTEDNTTPSNAEEMVDKAFDGLMTKFRKEYPLFSKIENKMVALFIMGFEAKTISLLTNYTVKSVYGKKDRIKKRIAKTTSPFKEEILRFLA